MQAPSASSLYTILEDPVVPKTMRSYSVSSSTSLSSTASTSSRTADELLDRMIATAPATKIHLWSAGNVRLEKLDLTTSPVEAIELIHAMHADPRFECIHYAHLDDSGDDWKMSFRRTEVLILTPPMSDSE